MLPEKELLKVVSDLPLISLRGPWTRAIELRHLVRDQPEPLWSGSANSRFTPKQTFRRLYLTSDFETALKEAGALFLNQPLANRPWTLIIVEGILESILDVTDLSICERLATSLAELTGDWRYPEGLYLQGEGLMPPTHLLGKAAFETGRVLGIRFRSAKNTGQGMNIVVFTDRLTRNQASFLEVYDPSGSLQQRIPENSVASFGDMDGR